MNIRRTLLMTVSTAVLCCMGAPVLFASASEKDGKLCSHDSFSLFSEPLYTYETDEESGSESLNRISGHIDTGFSSSDDSYESKNHYTGGPQGLEKAKTQQS